MNPRKIKRAQTFAAIVLVIINFRMVAAVDGEPATSDATNLSSSQIDSAGTNTIPPIHFEDVPITFGIETLARLAGTNYLLDPKVRYGKPDDEGNIKLEPLLNFRVTDVSAKQMLQRVLDVYGLRMIENPGTPIARITTKNQEPIRVDAALLGPDTDPAAPVIAMEDGALGEILASLTRKAHLEVSLDSSGLKKSSNPGGPEVSVSFHFQEVTPKQAIIAFCETYDLIISKDPATGALQIKPNG